MLLICDAGMSNKLTQTGNKMHATSSNIFQWSKQLAKMCKSITLQILGTAVQDSTEQLSKFSCLWIIISVSLYTICDFLRHFLPFWFSNSAGQEWAAHHTLLCLVCLVWSSWVAMDMGCADMMEIDSGWKLRILDLNTFDWACCEIVLNFTKFHLHRLCIKDI